MGTESSTDSLRSTTWMYRKPYGVPPSWAESKWLFEWDGSWLDIYVKGMSFDYWPVFFRFVQKAGDCVFTREGENAPLPESWSEELILNHSLEIKVGPITFSAV